MSTEKLTQALLEAKDSLNTVAVLSTKAERYATALRAKQKIADILADYEADKQAGRASAQAVPTWRPIETAPETEPVVVAWWESDETPHHDFDQLEDGCWQRWHDYAEHVEVIGGYGVSYTAPYTHWMPIPAAPTGA